MKANVDHNTIIATNDHYRWVEMYWGVVPTIGLEPVSFPFQCNALRSALLMFAFCRPRNRSLVFKWSWLRLPVSRCTLQNSNLAGSPKCPSICDTSYHVAGAQQTDGSPFLPCGSMAPVWFLHRGFPLWKQTTATNRMGVELGGDCRNEVCTGHRQQHSFSLGLTCNMYEMRGSDNITCKVPSSFNCSFGESWG